MRSAMANSCKRRSPNKKYYNSNKDEILSRRKVVYKANPEVSKEAAKASYNAEPELKKGEKS